MLFKKICRTSLYDLKKCVLSINPFIDTYKDDYIEDEVVIFSPYSFNNDMEEYLYTYVDIDGVLTPVYSFSNCIDIDDIYGELFIKGLDGQDYILYSELVLGSNGKYYSIYPNYTYTHSGAIVEVRGSAINNLNIILKNGYSYQKVLK